MAEDVGLEASAVTTAALFSNCIDCFSYFKAVQNCPDKEAERLLVKLDCEKTRLLVWANTVGILRTDRQGRSPELGDVQSYAIVQCCFDQISNFLTNDQKLQAEYGSRPTRQQEPQRYVALLSVNSMNLFETAKLRFFARAGGLNKKPTWIPQIKWAISDKRKFRIILPRIRKFVDKVIELVPVSPDVINNTVEEDITTIIDIKSLRLVKDACKEVYPSWSTKASEVIKESEIGTLDRRNLEEIIRAGEERETKAEQAPQLKTGQGLSVDWRLAAKTFVVFTDECLDLEADSQCESASIGKALTADRDSSFSCTSAAKWNLGRRIVRNIKSPFDSRDELDKAESRRFEVSQLTGELPDVIPVRRIYIHCGPCACAIRTALKITRDNGASEYFDFAIRIDERLPTSCLRNCVVVNVLAAIHDFIDGYSVEPFDSASKSIGFIECPDLERRIYNLEQESFRSTEPELVIQKILNESDQDERDLQAGANIFIMEAGLCHLSLENRPFQSEARMPRATDIFAFKAVWNESESEYLWHRKYMGSYTRSEEALKKNEARSILLANPIPPAMSHASASALPLPRNKRPRPRSDSSTISGD